MFRSGKTRFARSWLSSVSRESRTSGHRRARRWPGPLPLTWFAGTFTSRHRISSGRATSPSTRPTKARSNAARSLTCSHAGCLAGRSIRPRPSQMVMNALGMATEARHPNGELVIHSDRGSQFASWAFSQKVKQAGLAPSMGSVGSAYDNAMMESSGVGCRSNSSAARDGRPGSSSPTQSTTT